MPKWIICNLLLLKRTLCKCFWWTCSNWLENSLFFCFFLFFFVKEIWWSWFCVFFVHFGNRLHCLRISSVCLNFQVLPCYFSCKNSCCYSYIAVHLFGHGSVIDLKCLCTKDILRYRGHKPIEFQILFNLSRIMSKLFSRFLFNLFANAYTETQTLLIIHCE